MQLGPWQLALSALDSVGAQNRSLGGTALASVPVGRRVPDRSFRSVSFESCCPLKYAFAEMTVKSCAEKSSCSVSTWKRMLFCVRLHVHDG